MGIWSSLFLIIPIVLSSCSTLKTLFPSGTVHPWFERVLDKKQGVVPFNNEKFARQCSLATVLAFDDLAAWWTSDSITAEKNNRLDSLDNTWFVQADDGGRRVYYGRYFPATDTYAVKYAFEVASDSSVHRLPESVDSSTLNLARAVYSGSNHFSSITDSLMLDFKFNHYIRRNEDRTYSMWFFPAGVDNYCAYGLAITLAIDTSGNDIFDVVLTGNELKYFEVHKKLSSIELDNTYDDVPSIANIFFVLVYGKHFQRITIKNRNSTSTAIRSSTSDTLQWINGPR